MLDTLLTDGWAYHDRESERLAVELEAAARQGVETAELDKFLGLATHTLGEHLRDWPRARRLAEQVTEGRTPSPETTRAWSRLGVARLLSGDAPAAAAAELAAMAAAPDPLAAMIEARFLLLAALVGSGRAAEAAGIYEAALALAERLGDAAPARAIAVASNNLAYDLVEAPTRTADDDAVMRLAAEATAQFWGKIGTWQHAEMALCLKARVALLLGEPDAAIIDADAGLALIAANGEAPADNAILHVVRAAALDRKGDTDGKADELAKAEAVVAAADADARDFYADQRAWILGEHAPT